MGLGLLLGLTCVRFNTDGTKISKPRRPVRTKNLCLKLHYLYISPYITRAIKSRYMRWARHVALTGMVEKHREGNQDVGAVV